MCFLAVSDQTSGSVRQGWLPTTDRVTQAAEESEEDAVSVWSVPDEIQRILHGSAHSQVEVKVRIVLLLVVQTHRPMCVGGSECTLNERHRYRLSDRADSKGFRLMSLVFTFVHLQLVI